jgi:hypothetical protein
MPQHASLGGVVFSNLQIILAESAEAFVAASLHGSTDSQASTLQALCAVLARVLGRHLSEAPDSNQWRRIDGIVPEWAAAVSATECEVWGLAIWDDQGRHQWAEPFAASLSLAGGEALGAYRLCFGDAAAGLGHAAVGGRRKHHVRDHPPEWLFTFTSPAA